MELKEFQNNLKEIYNLSNEYEKRISKFFLGINKQGSEQEFLDNFLGSQNLPKNKESRFALASKLYFLKNTSLTQFLKKQKISEDKKQKILEKTYLWVKKFYEKDFDEFIQEIENKNLLTEFYLEIIKGVHNVGKKMNVLQIKWKEHISKVNKELEKKFKEPKKIMGFLRKENLLDKGHNNKEADRCYSVLIKEGEKYKRKSYFEVFEEVKEIVGELKKFKNNLENLEDEIYNQKEKYINYLDSLINAFSEVEVDGLVKVWAEVDVAWMKITTPFQIAHPLEYYDDAYRHSVSIEWDLRLKNFNLPENKRKDKIKSMYEKLFEKFGREKWKKIFEKSIANLERVQLYLSKPILFYGSELDGLFSAQVVPNDLEVSKKFGKKIFGFSEMVLNQSRDSPFTKLSKEVFEEKYVREAREFLFNETEKWHRIYDFETIGHEFGHILWLDDDSETKMNKTGNFKNIEEFKATMGGVISFIFGNEKELKREFFRDILSRAISLISWMEEESYRPYYCEVLIQLHGFIESGILSFNGEKIIIDLDSEEKYEKLEAWEIQTYEKLIKNYLNKIDASEFLENYLEYENKTFFPKNKKLREIVEFFYKKYQEFGNQIDESVSKEDYIRK